MFQTTAESGETQFPWEMFIDWIDQDNKHISHKAELY